MKVVAWYNMRRVRKYMELFRGVLVGGDSVLDVGLGDGLLAAELQRVYGVRVVGLDVVDYNKTGVPLCVYDGRSFPFRSGRFDWVLVFVTLHHCDDVEGVLREARRVARRGVVVYENPYTSLLNRWLIVAHDFVSNWRKGVRCPYKHKTYEGWLGVFARLGLRVGYERRFVVWKFFVLPSHRVLWVLR